MQTEKQCSNKCGTGWCCHNEFFVDSMQRVDKEAVELHSFKGIEVKQFPMNDPRRFTHVLIKVPVTCRQLTETGCGLGSDRPEMCKVFPNEHYRNWVLHKDCDFYVEGMHWNWDDLEDYKPEI